VTGREGGNGREGGTGRERGREGVSALLYYANLPNWFEVYCVKLVVSIPHAGPCTLHIKVLPFLMIIEDERIIGTKFKRNQVKHLICLR